MGAVIVGAVLLAACGESVSTPVTLETPTPAAAPSATPTPRPSLGAVVVEAGEEVRIGISASFSGETAILGEDIRDAVTLAVEDFGPDILGFPVTLVAEDDGCTDAERATAAANHFAADSSIVAVIGPQCSDGASAANLMYERAGLLHVSASASMPALTEKGSKVFFRTVWRDDRQGAALADYALGTLGASTSVAIDDGEPYAEAVATEFVRLFEERRGGMATREKIAVGQRDFSGLLERLMATSPDAVLFAGFPSEGVPFLHQLREAGYQGVLLAPDSLFAPSDFVAEAGESAEGAQVLGPPPLPVDVAAAFQERFGREARTPFIGHAYDAAMALLTAIDTVADEDESRLTIDRRALLESLRSHVFTGLTGRIRFDGKGDRAGVTPEEIGLTLYIVNDGEFVPAGENVDASVTPTPTVSPTAIP